MQEQGWRGLTHYSVCTLAKLKARMSGLSKQWQQTLNQTKRFEIGMQSI
jgi:hypothetical protein